MRIIVLFFLSVLFLSVSEKDRNKKKVAEKFLKVENELMIYHHVEVIDESEKVMGLQQDVSELKSIMEQLMEQKDISTKLQLEIQKLKK